MKLHTKKLKKEYNALIQKLKEQYYHQRIYHAKGDGKKIWQTINEVLQREKKILLKISASEMKKMKLQLTQLK